jgi:iron complex transport system substrate-binding protein
MVGSILKRLAGLAGLMLAPVVMPQPAVMAQTITVTDLENRQVTLARPAERVASIPIPLASTLIALDGGTRRLVGMNPIAKSAIVEGILGRIFPAARDIPSDIVGTNFMPNIEQLAATRPDLVLQWGGRGNDIVAPLMNAGMPVALILCCREEWTRSYHDMLAAAIGRPERARENTQWREAVLARLAAKVGAIPAERRPRVLHLQQALVQLTAAGRGTYNGWQIEQAGGVNVAAGLDNFRPVNAEQIAAWNPDVILLNSFEDKLTLGRVLDDPVLSSTRAARTRRVYKLPLGGYRWDPPSHESPLTWMWLANLLHPEIFDFDLRSEMRSAYATLYGHTLSAAETDEILRIATQGDTANYARFRAR